MFFAVLLVLVQLGSAVYTPGVYKTCLSCPHLVSHTYECTTIAEIWPDEQCFTDVVILLNGSRAYRFGYEAETDCLTPSSTHDRHRRMLSRSIVLCHECCVESLCNRRLCGVPGSNDTNLVCLMGNEVSGLPFAASITYCSEGERCYGERLPHATNARPNQPNYGNYGCASQAICDHLSSLSDDGPEARCRKCCSEDGCNAHVCQLELQNPTETMTSSMGPSRSNTITMTTTMDTTQATRRFVDCWDHYSRGGHNHDGVYDIYPAPSYSRLRVRCDMTTDGGGWTVVQRRYDGSVNFARTMEEYREGFGDMASEFWLGLESLHVLSTQGDASVQLRVDVCTFNGTMGFAKYDVFSIAGQNDTYRLNIERRSFTGHGLRDQMRYQNGHTFSITGLGGMVTGGWWYYSRMRGGAYFVNLNGGYSSGALQGIIWYAFGGGSYVRLKSSEIKIRPVGVTGSTSHSYTCPS